MNKVRLFMDTHTVKSGTFPEGITDSQFSDFYAKYSEICKEEGVISLKTHVSFEAGTAFCLNMAPNEKAVHRVHERVGLPYDSISEVKTVTPGDLFFNSNE